MISFGKLKITGFGSIGDLEVDLGQKGITIIKGPIGAGKSTILSALVWVIYGKNVKGVSEVETWKKFRPKDYRGCKVEVLFNNGKGVKHIIRCQKYADKINGAKGANRLIYLRDMEEVIEKRKGEIQGLITADIGMSYSLFMNSIMFGQGLKRLIQETGKEQKDIFEELLEVTWLTKAKGITKEYLDKVVTNLNELKDKWNSLLDKRENYKATYKELKEHEENFLEQKAIKIRALNKEEKLSAIRFNKISNNPPKEQITHPDLQKKFKEKLRFAREKLQESRNSKSSLSVESIVNETIDLILVGEQNQALENLKRIQSIFKSISRYSKHVERCTAKLSYCDALEREWDDWEEKSRTARKKLKDIRNNIRALKNEEIKTSSDKYLKLAKKVKKEMLGINEEIEKYEKKLEAYQWVYNDALGQNGLKAFLFESSMDFINETLANYGEILGFNILFYMDIYSARKDFKTQIIMEGVEVKYEELSGGQKQLVNLAIAFAMNEVISSSKGINIAFLDEIFENLNMEAIETVISLIQRVYKDKTLFLISHHDSLPIHNAKSLQVTRNKGLSVYS